MSRRRTYVMVPTLMTVVAFLWALPLVWVILLSLKPNELLRQAGWSLFVPYPLTVEHYETLLRVSQAPQWLLNSFVVAASVTILTVTLSTLAGYALARIPFPGKSAVVIGLTAGMMIPEQTVFLPLHALIADWNLHNSYAALVAPRLAGPFGVLVMAQFFKAVPRELEEAAILDHAGPFKILWTIMLPLSRPAVTTLAIFTFLADGMIFSGLLCLQQIQTCTPSPSVSRLYKATLRSPKAWAFLWPPLSMPAFP